MRIVEGKLVCGDKEYYFSETTWFSFMVKINEMMREFEITYPVGEDENMEMVTKAVKDVDKFS